MIRLAILLLVCCSSSHATPADSDTDSATTGRPAFPVLEPHSGRVLDPLHLVTVVAQNDTMATALFAFSDYLVASSWWQAADAAFALGTATSQHYTGPAITADVTQDDMIAYLQGAIGSGAPAPDGQTLYLLYLPAGIKNTGPIPFAAYHAPFPAQGQGLGDGWAVVSRVTPFGGGETQLQQLTRAASHEIVEAATDPGWNSWSLAPPPTQPWTGAVWQVEQIPGPIETADLCTGSRFVEADGNESQRFFSNQAAVAGGDPCVPAIADAYYNTTADHDWTEGTAATTLSIPVTGWSVGSVSDWGALAVVIQASPGFMPIAGQVLAMTSPLGNETTPCLGIGVNAGVVASVQIPIPPGAVSGDYVVIEIESFRDDLHTCYPPPAGDQYHFWLVGAYVP